MLVNHAAISRVLQKNAALMAFLESHDTPLFTQSDPGRIVVRHGYLIVAIEPHECPRGFAGAFTNAPNIGVGQANDGIAAAITATGAAKLEIAPPIWTSHETHNSSKTKS